MYKVYAITDIGRERSQNQDGFLVDGMHCECVQHREIYYESDGSCIHVALCDGVGSTMYASLAVKIAQTYICNHLYVSEEHELENLVIDMNAYVFDSLREANKADAACTIAGVVMNGATAFIYNIGDSPVFTINNGYLEKQSTDDTGVSMFGEQVSDDGDIQIKPPLIQSIGTNRLIDLVHIKCERDNVAFLLCTDGITDMLSLDEMEDILGSTDSIKEAAQRLVETANARGGFDNSTVIIMVDEEE